MAATDFYVHQKNRLQTKNDYLTGKAPYKFESGSLQRRVRKQSVPASKVALEAAGLVPVILFHDMVIGVSGFMVTVFFLGFAISPLWTATMDIAPHYARHFPRDFRRQDCPTDQNR
jgi:hypothetical protein